MNNRTAFIAWSIGLIITALIGGWAWLWLVLFAALLITVWEPDR